MPTLTIQDKRTKEQMELDMNMVLSYLEYFQIKHGLYFRRLGIMTIINGCKVPLGFSVN